jgi:hypothetical protein
VKHFYRGAVVAHQSGQTLAGIFLLRTIIEQWARLAALSLVCGPMKLWDYHFVARAAFPSGLMGRLPEYESPQFYIDKGIHFRVRVPRPLLQGMERRLGNVGHWLNQNYIIRLFGILDQDGVITAGKKEGNPYTLILALLRQRVRAHSRGYRNPKSREVRRLEVIS